MLLRNVMRKIRGWVYALGFRPKLGSIFHSPSRSGMIVMQELDVSGAFEQSLNTALNNSQTLQKQIKENKDV